MDKMAMYAENIMVGVTVRFRDTLEENNLALQREVYWEGFDFRC
jgi:hypothetical protein